MATPQNRPRHLYLLIALLVLVVLTPILAPFRHGIVLINTVGAAMLVSAVYAISDRKQLVIIAIVLSAISIITNSLMLMYPSHLAVAIAHSFMISVLSFFAVTILSYVVRAGHVTVDRIYAAVCAYLLIGYAWAFAYALFDEFHPGAFSTPTEVAPNDYVGRIMQLRYFSFITLATVGYGDIAPRATGARTMAILEAMMGQFYLVALIGRLVGLHIVHGSEPRK
jgi:voltage-gated potassium channel